MAGESGVRLDDRGRNLIPTGRRKSGLDRAQAAAAEPATSGGYLVAISSQASEAEALASFKVLQAKYAAVLGQYQPIIKRLDFGEKGGVRFRVAVGPFETRQQASAMCGSLKLAGGQCFPFGSQ
ncbi:SPOR domain-containing protein [Bradyrhizobium sp. ORS 375]|uniref:SPOR domain-containing protein n=1 Tax=Bradyrhizobium sp. (strain ORS 375) TaxID=566679 RepID=UPI0002F0A670